MSFYSVRRHPLVRGLAILLAVSMATPTMAKSPTKPDSSNKEKKGDTLPIPEPNRTSLKECKPRSLNEVVEIQFQQGEVPIDGLLKGLQDLLCKTIVYAGKSMANNAPKMFIQAPKALRLGALYKLVLTALSSVNLTIQEQGEQWVVMDVSKAKEGAPMLKGPLPNRDVYVTRIIRLKYLSGADVQPLLKEASASDRATIYFPATNALIVVDTANNVARFESLINELDGQKSPKICWIHPKRLSASTAVGHLQTLLLGQSSQMSSDRSSAMSRRGRNPSIPSGDGGNTPWFKVSVDERSNLVFILGPKEACDRSVALLNTLEELNNQSNESIQTDFYDLSYVSAQTAIGLLNQVPGISASFVPNPATATNTNGASPTNNASLLSPARSRNFLDSDSSDDNQTSMFNRNITVIGDQSSNKLLLIGSRSDVEMAKGLLQKIDYFRPQVYVEAVILELTFSKKRDLGVSFHGGIPLLGGIFGLGLQGKSGSASSLSPYTALTLPGLIGGLFSKGTVREIAGSGAPPSALVTPQFGVILSALDTVDSANVLQSPGVCVNNGYPGHFEVGQEVPVPSGFANALPGGSATLTPITSVQRITTGYELDATPSINAATNQVSMHLLLKVGDIVPGEVDKSLGVRTYKRLLTTDITVRDQQPAVVGGIMIEKTGENTTKIPILGDIPLLGNLFKTRSKTSETALILIVLTPYIIQSPFEQQKIFDKKMEEYRRQLERTSWPAPEIARKINYDRTPTLLQHVTSLNTKNQATREKNRAMAASKQPLPVQSGVVP